MKLKKTTDRRLPGKAPAKPSRSRKRIPDRWLLVLVSGVLALVLIFALVSYRSQETKQRDAAALEADRATFVKIEADMERTYTAIIAATGEPDESKKNRFCSRPNLKFEEGDLSCTINYAFTYKSQSFADSKAVLDRIKASFISLGIFQIIGDSSNTLIENVRFQAEGFDLNNSYGAVCKVRYEIDEGSGRQTGFKNDNYTSNYDFRCNRLSQKVYD